MLMQRVLGRGLLLVAILGVGCGGWLLLSPRFGHAAAAVIKKSPKLVFDDRSFDFGAIARGTKHAHRFRFKNAGDATLVIQGVHAACGCTAVMLEQGREYAPGESGEIEVRFDATDFSGPVVKTVTVMSNERPQSDRLLTLKAQVNSEIAATPPLLDFGDVRPKEAVERQVRLSGLGPKPLQVTGLVFNAELFEASFKKDGQDWLVSVRLKPGLAPGFIKETLVVKNDSANLKELKVPIRATLKASIDVAPAYLEFGALAIGGKVRKAVTMQGLSKFKVTGITSELMINGRRITESDKFIKVEAQNDPKQHQQLAVELSHVAKYAGSVHGKVIVATDDPEAKAMTVDFYAFFR